MTELAPDFKKKILISSRSDVDVFVICTNQPTKEESIFHFCKMTQFIPDLMKKIHGEFFSLPFLSLFCIMKNFVFLSEF